MNNNDDSNYVSVGTWMWMMFVTAIPVIGVIMVFVWAFTGENQSRKNYYRAILAWVLVLVLLTVAIVALSGAAVNWPAIQKHLHDLTHKA